MILGPVRALITTHRACRVLPATSIADLGGRRLATPPLAHLSISPGEMLLAAAHGGEVELFAVADLTGGAAEEPAQPVASWALPAGTTAAQVGSCRGRT